MYIPDLGTLLATTSSQMQTVSLPIMSVALWFAGISVAGIFGAVILGIPQRIFEWISTRRNAQVYGDKWGANEAALRRAGYEQYYDQIADKSYLKKGSHKVWLD